MHIFTKTTLTFSILLLFNACGGGSHSEPFSLANTVELNEHQYFRVIAPKTCNQTNKNRFIYQVMHDSYLWADDVPELDYTSNEYNSSEKMLNALRSEHDKFSFIVDAKIIQSFFEEGKNNNLGLGLAIVKLNATTHALIVRFVYPNSPADKNGIKRGDIIQRVEGKAITKENINEIANILNNQRKINFTFLKPDKTTFDKTITKASYSIQTVFYHNIITTSDKSKKIGYMVFQDFIQNAKEELDNVFSTFKKENVNELILDLRYNGGGATNIANHLASLIGGNHVAQNIFDQMKYNERYSQYNETVYFEEVHKNALNLNRVFVITTPDTCSSSELIISSLRASANNIEVIQIGDTTCGKPYMDMLVQDSFVTKPYLPLTSRVKMVMISVTMSMDSPQPAKPKTITLKHLETLMKTLSPKH